MSNTPIPVGFVNGGHQPNPVGHGSIHDTHHRCSQQPTFVPPNVPPSQVFPETEYPEIDIPDSAKLSNGEKLMLLKLLKDWNLKFLFRTLNEALVGIEALQFITPAQCESMLNSYPLGIRIKFTAKVTQLQRDYSRVSSHCDHRVHVPHVPMYANSYM
uniref:Uncharacterized protein n=1 Tax=Schizaphis graminum TaxID=13262 RepID=A0A2S2P0Y3_SCHGA